MIRILNIVFKYQNTEIPAVVNKLDFGWAKIEEGHKKEEFPPPTLRYFSESP